MVLAQSARSNPDYLQTVLPVFSLGTNLVPSFDITISHEPLIILLFNLAWPSVAVINCNTHVETHSIYYRVVV